MAKNYMTASRGGFNSYLPPIPPFTPLPYHRVTPIPPPEKIKAGGPAARSCKQQDHMTDGGNGVSYVLVMFMVCDAGFGQARYPLAVDNGPCQ